MAQNLFIPTIKAFQINNYPLFKDTWRYEVKPGINILLGANAIGKTTTINMLIYGLVGIYEDYAKNKVDGNYFLERITSIDPDSQVPSIDVQVELDSHIINISRALNHDKIEYLSVDGFDFQENETVTLNEQYKLLLKELGNIEDINDLSFLLSKMLIREEEGNYLLWDQVSQSRALRLLINYSGFQGEFKNLEDQLQIADSKYKREADFLSKMRGRRKELDDDRQKQLNKNQSFLRKEDLVNEIKNLKSNRTPGGQGQMKMLITPPRQELYLSLFAPPQHFPPHDLRLFKRFPSTIQRISRCILVYQPLSLLLFNIFDLGRQHYSLSLCLLAADTAFNLQSFRYL